jgi:methyl-accepting chemotaxis protein
MNYNKEEMVSAIVKAIDEIPHSAEDMGKIIAAVDELACQANLLALRMAAGQITPLEPFGGMR